MKYLPYRFARPDDLELATRPKLSVAIVIACRDGQDAQGCADARGR